jgi:hypothetical protein
MDCSLDDALTLLRQWNSNNSAVRLSFAGRGIKILYSSGRITDVSGREVTFATEGVRFEFDVGTLSPAELISLGSSEEVPGAIKELSKDSDEAALMFRGLLGDILVILKEKIK